MSYEVFTLLLKNSFSKEDNFSIFIIFAEMSPPNGFIAILIVAFFIKKIYFKNR